jgi:hypothetical protein
VVASTLVLATGVDLVTGVTAVISAMNSIGPGLGVVGPAGSYAALPDTCKWIVSICMDLHDGGTPGNRHGLRAVHPGVPGAACDRRGFWRGM